MGYITLPKNCRIITIVRKLPFTLALDVMLLDDESYPVLPMKILSFFITIHAKLIHTIIFAFSENSAHNVG
jgi:hypothetical protein